MNDRTVSSAANQKWARFPHRGTISVQTYANLFASPINHLSGRNIFRPDVGHRWRLTAWSFLPYITFCTGERYFAPTFGLGTPSPDRHHGRCQSSMCLRKFSHLQSFICRGEIFFARMSAIGVAKPPIRLCPASFVARAKYFSPLRSRLVLRHPIATPTAANHQYVRKPFRIPDHPFVWAKYFSPDIGHWWRVTA